ncbi:MAG TPA: radical SAM protein [Longimicrobiales bacterium]|nr:radical SAM protein [Longimicrobiales bacterium]
MRTGLPVLDGVADMGIGLAPHAPLDVPQPATAVRTVAPETFVPHVVAWNLTQRCNLACAHCYIAAGSWHTAANELTTTECLRITDEILSISPAPMFILSGGEPLLRDDLEQIAAHAAAGGATVVVGTNGTRLTRERIRSLKAAGVRGVAISVDSLDERYHDRFRHGTGALGDTLAGVARLREEELDFVVQTSLTRGNRAELDSLAAWAERSGAVSFNVYFLVSTGRGEGMSGLSPAENEEVLQQLAIMERRYRGRMLIRSKCQPQIMRHVHAADPESPLLNYGTRCPCGVHYCRITPEGRITPCPYMPVAAGDLRAHSFVEIWRDSPVFARLRQGEPGGKCGRCEYRALCGGCRARAHADTGDFMAEDGSCAYQPSGDVPLIEARSLTYGGAIQAPAMTWSPDAEARLARIPGFVRSVVVERIETFARARGYDAITIDVMAEVRRSMPVDFAKRMPFFMRGDGD